MTDNDLIQIREALNELGDDGDFPQMNTISKCINKIAKIVSDAGY